jgi:hypothetical protein
VAYENATSIDQESEFFVCHLQRYQGHTSQGWIEISR